MKKQSNFLLNRPLLEEYEEFLLQNRESSHSLIASPALTLRSDGQSSAAQHGSSVLASKPRKGIQMDVGNAKCAVGYAGMLQCMTFSLDNLQIDCRAAIDENSVFVCHALIKAGEGLSSVNKMF